MLIDDKIIRLRTDEKNEKCIGCKEKCKQSKKVVVVSCKNYKKRS